MKLYILFSIFITTIIVGCNPTESELPDELIGNYYEKDSKDYWNYSLQKSFIIQNCKFWDIRKVKNKKGITKVIIENENSRNKILISPISNGSYKFESNKSSSICSTIADPDSRKAKNNRISMRPGKVYICGLIKNSAKYIESTPSIQFLYHDYITIDTYRVYAPIDSLGRFQMEMELLSPQDIMYILDNKLNSVFVAPGDTLMIYLDPENPESSDFQGTNSDVNYDLLRTKGSRFEIASSKENNIQLSKHFTGYKAYRDSVKNREIRFLNEYSKNYYCSELFKTWYKINSEICYFTELLNYSWKNYHVKDEENSKAFHSYIDVFLSEINMDDTIAPITGMYFFFTNAVNNKISPDRQSLYTSINTALPIVERRAKYSEVYLTKMVERINALEEGRLRDILYAKLVTQEIQNRNIEHIDKTLDVVDDHIQYKPYLTHLSNHVASFKQKEAEFINNPITLRRSNSSGERLLKKIINDNIGKVIILDFWYTGCAPCRSDFKRLSEFKKDLFIEADVEFVYFCYNSTEENWKYVSKEFNLQGQNYLLTQEQIMYFQKLFSISSAPRYVLINKSGKVVNSNFNPPINKDQFIITLKNAI